MILSTNTKKTFHVSTYQFQHVQNYFDVKVAIFLKYYYIMTWQLTAKKQLVCKTYSISNYTFLYYTTIKVFKALKKIVKNIKNIILRYTDLYNYFYTPTLKIFFCRL